MAPLECNLDALAGISYSKGCYIGQERNSYTHYRGIIRRRMMPVLLPRVEASTREYAIHRLHWLAEPVQAITSMQKTDSCCMCTRQCVRVMTANIKKHVRWRVALLLASLCVKGLLCSVSDKLLCMCWCMCVTCRPTVPHTHSVSCCRSIVTISCNTSSSHAQPWGHWHSHCACG